MKRKKCNFRLWRVSKWRVPIFLRFLKYLKMPHQYKGFVKIYIKEFSDGKFYALNIENLWFIFHIAIELGVIKWYTTSKSIIIFILYALPGMYEKCGKTAKNPKLKSEIFRMFMFILLYSCFIHYIQDFCFIYKNRGLTVCID